MSEFHFIRPIWLVAIVALVIAIALLKKVRLAQSGWHQFLPKHLAKVLIDGQQNNKPLSLTLPLVGLRPVGAFGYLLWLHRPARLTFGAVQ